MANMKALRVKILQKASGGALYPAFNDLPSVQAEGVDWSYYIDRKGLGWAYDKQSGHDDEDVDSPRGQQWGVIVVDPTFADEAVAAFPDVCSIIDEATLQTFWEDRAHAHLDDDDVNDVALEGIRKQVELLKDLRASGVSNAALDARLGALRVRLRTALDPDDPAPGVRRNLRRRWATWKAKKGVSIV